MIGSSQSKKQEEENSHSSNYLCETLMSLKDGPQTFTKYLASVFFSWVAKERNGERSTSQN